MVAASAFDVLVAEVGVQDRADATAWTISVLEAVTKPRMWRASGSSVRAETR